MTTTWPIHDSYSLRGIATAVARIPRCRPAQATIDENDVQDRRWTIKTAKKSFTYAIGNPWRVKYWVGPFISWAPLKTLGLRPTQREIFDGHHGPLSLCCGPFIGLSLPFGAFSLLWASPPAVHGAIDQRSFKGGPADQHSRLSDVTDLFLIIALIAINLQGN